MPHGAVACFGCHHLPPGAHPLNPRHRQAHRPPPRTHQEDQSLAPCPGHRGLYGAEPCVYRSNSPSFLYISWGIRLLSSCHWQLLSKIYRASFPGLIWIILDLRRTLNNPGTPGWDIFPCEWNCLRHIHSFGIQLSFSHLPACLPGFKKLPIVIDVLFPWHKLSDLLINQIWSIQSERKI